MGLDIIDLRIFGYSAQRTFRTKANEYKYRSFIFLTLMRNFFKQYLNIHLFKDTYMDKRSTFKSAK